ncbi:PAS domain S-box protein [Deinococcus humi]|nr:PAS domain S-box protein [Deinococcus humi]
MRQVIESSAVGTVMTDALQNDQPIVYVNPAFERLSGYSAAELLGRNCRLLQGHDRDQPGVRELHQAIEQQHSQTVTLRNYRKDSTLFYNELTLNPLRDATGTVTHFVGFQHDVTAREEARLHEDQLHGQLTSTLGQMTDGFVSLDRDLNYIYLNAAAARIAGKRPEELTGHNLLTTFPESEDSAVVQATQRARETRRSHTAVSHLKAFGRWVEATAYPTEDGVSVFIRDITQQRQAEEDRRSSEEPFASVFEAAPMAMVVSRLSDHHYIDVNPEFLRASGYSREEMIGRTPLDLKFWDDPLEFEAVGRILREQGKVLNREVQFRLKSGMLAQTVVSVVPVTIDGEACLLTLVRDITSEKRARQQLEESEERHRQLATELQRTLDLSLDIIATIGPDAKLISINAACQRVLGYTPEELIGRSLLELVHPDDQIAPHAVGADTLQESAGDQQGAPIYQSRYLHKNGHTVWLEWNATVIPDHLQTYCVARDITGRKMAEEDQAFLAAIVQASHDAIIGVTLDSTIRSWNVGAEELYGYPAAEAVGQPITLIVPSELHVQEAEMLRRTGQGERLEPFESVRIAKDGRRVPVLITASPILDAAGRVVGVSKIAQDITARLAAEQEIQTLNDSLHQQLRQITGLRAIDQSIAASANLHLTLSLVVDNLCEQLGVDAASALLLNPETLALEYTALRGFSSANLQRPSVKVGVALAGQVALSGQPLHVPDLSTVRFSPEEHNLLQHDGFTSAAYYAVPLITKGKVVGVIEVLQRQVLPLSSIWLEMLGTLASQAAIAVENVQLFTELERKNLELRLAYDETIEGWARALDLRDKETQGHSRRVTEMTVALCQQLGVPSEKLVNVRRGALLHDIGKMGIPDAILLKPGKLTDEEWAEMRKHPDYAVELLSPIRFLRPALDIPEYHHEKWDGSGYPLGLKGEVIPLTARAFAVVDVYDALTSDRPYRPAWSGERALAHIRSGAGSHFDPHVVEVFFQLLQRDAPISGTTEQSPP